MTTEADWAQDWPSSALQFGQHTVNARRTESRLAFRSSISGPDKCACATVDRHGRESRAQEMANALPKVIGPTPSLTFDHDLHNSRGHNSQAQGQGPRSSAMSEDHASIQDVPRVGPRYLEVSKLASRTSSYPVRMCVYGRRESNCAADRSLDR